jgi:hypothetical protein
MEKFVSALANGATLVKGATPAEDVTQAKGTMSARGPTPANGASSVSPQDYVHNTRVADFIGNSAPIYRPTTSRVPNFNRTRIVKPAAGKAKTPKYTDWLANEEYLDELKHQSYIKDQQVVIPGKLPAAPVYGPSRELQIKVSPNFPTVYAQRITPSDFDELIEQNQTLRNKVLERMWACPICNMGFKTHNNTNIREHMQEHIKQMQEAGECPLCGNTSWALMSTDQKRAHFEWHIARQRAAAVQNPWRQVRCPACDEDLSTLQPEAIVEHCLKHSPDIVQYCDKCGLHEAKCTKEEQMHHQKVCREAPERKNGDPEPVFCEYCGKDTSTQTQTQKTLHARDCQNKPTASSKIFCTKCGLDITVLNNVQLASHTSRCVVPRGIKRKFCRRCATDLSEGDATRKSLHRRSCRSHKVMTPPSDVEQFTGMLLQDFEQFGKPTPISFPPRHLICTYRSLFL